MNPSLTVIAIETSFSVIRRLGTHPVPGTLT